MAAAPGSLPWNRSIWAVREPKAPGVRDQLLSVAKLAASAGGAQLVKILARPEDATAAGSRLALASLVAGALAALLAALAVTKLLGLSIALRRRKAPRELTAAQSKLLGLPEARRAGPRGGPATAAAPSPAPAPPTAPLQPPQRPPLARHGAGGGTPSRLGVDFAGVAGVGSPGLAAGGYLTSSPGLAGGDAWAATTPTPQGPRRRRTSAPPAVETPEELDRLWVSFGRALGGGEPEAGGGGGGGMYAGGARGSPLGGGGETAPPSGGGSYGNSGYGLGAPGLSPYGYGADGSERGGVGLGSPAYGVGSPYGDPTSTPSPYRASARPRAPYARPERLASATGPGALRGAGGAERARATASLATDPAVLSERCDELREWFARRVLGPLVQTLDGARRDLAAAAVQVGWEYPIPPVPGWVERGEAEATAKGGWWWSVRSRVGPGSGGTPPVPGSGALSGDGDPAGHPPGPPGPSGPDTAVLALRAALLRAVARPAAPAAPPARSLGLFAGFGGATPAAPAPPPPPSPALLSCLRLATRHLALSALLRGELPSGILPPAPADYLGFRLRDLAEGGCVAAFRWDSGGSWEGRPWTPELPTDSAVLFYLFAAFLASPGWNFGPGLAGDAATGPRATPPGNLPGVPTPRDGPGGCLYLGPLPPAAEAPLGSGPHSANASAAGGGGLHLANSLLPPSSPIGRPTSPLPFGGSPSAAALPSSPLATLGAAQAGSFASLGSGGSHLASGASSEPPSPSTARRRGTAGDPAAPAPGSQPARPTYWAVAATRPPRAANPTALLGFSIAAPTPTFAVLRAGELVLTGTGQQALWEAAATFARLAHLDGRGALGPASLRLLGLDVIAGGDWEGEGAGREPIWRAWRTWY